MEKKNRMLGKVILIMIGLVVLVWLMHKDDTGLMLKQPQGEGITIEETVILIETFTDVCYEVHPETDWTEVRMWLEKTREDSSEEVLLLYGTFKELYGLLNKKLQLEIARLGNDEKRILQIDTYNTRYRDEFYLVKEDFYHFFDAMLSVYELSERIQTEEIIVLTCGNNLTGEQIEEKSLVTKDAAVMNYRSKKFEECSFSKISAYVLKDWEKGQHTLLTLQSKSDDMFTLQNVWLMETAEHTIQFFYQGYEMLAGVKGADAGAYERECVSDITFRCGRIVEIKQKKERISGRLLQRSEKQLELMGCGTYELTEEVKIYQLYETLREGSLEELSIGYDFADYVLEDGKICAILIVRKENMESIRVAIKTDGFDSLYHEQIRLSADSEMIMNYGDYGNRKTKVLKSGEILTIEADSEYLQGDRIELIPKVWSGKTEVLSLQRNQGIPIYRGKMEIVKANQGLLLINELLLEEYLYSVVPSEMPASYPEEALKAQAVCARTYAYQYLNYPGLPEIGAHVDDSVGYQVYNNISENSNSTKAVKETTGELLFYQGDPVSTYYYSTSCGFGADAGVWNAANEETMPYLVSGRIWGKNAANQGMETESDGEVHVEGEKRKQDEMDAEDMKEEENVRAYLREVQSEDFEAQEAWYRWEYRVDKADAELLSEKILSRYEAAPDKIVSLKDGEESKENPKQFTKVYEIKVQKRKAGGVIDELLIRTDAGDFKIVSEYNVRFVLNQGGKIRNQNEQEVAIGTLLPSAYFYIDAQTENESITGYRIVGGGYGHGVGMSQNAAKAMGNAGWEYGEILAYFYHSCEKSKLY